MPWALTPREEVLAVPTALGDLEPCTAEAGAGAPKMASRARRRAAATSPPRRVGRRSKGDGCVERVGAVRSLQQFGRLIV
jgi:hypothetical protein